MESNTYISKEYMPLKIGEKRKVFLKNGSSIITKWKSLNEYIIRYKPENDTDYFTPYFLLKFKNGNLRRLFPYPNFRAFLIAIISVLGVIYFKKVKTDLSFMLFSVALIFTVLIQVLAGIVSYFKIKENVFKKE